MCKIMCNELESIGKRIRSIRNNIAMSQSELAFEIGTDKAYVSRIERGEINIGILLFIKICTALKAKPDDLILF